MSNSIEIEFVERVSKPVDLVDGPHTYFYCSNCEAPLLDIWHTQPTNDTVWKIRADCPFCGDHSYVQEVKSAAFCPAALDVVGGPYCGLGDWDSVEINNEEIIIFKMVKAREYNG